MKKHSNLSITPIKPKSLSIFHSSQKVHFMIDPLKKNSFTPKFSVDEVLKRRSFRSLHFQHSKAVEKNEDDYDNELLLGSLSKSLSFKRKKDKEIKRQKSLRESKLTPKNDPFIMDTPSDFIKQSYSYRKTFKTAFTSFLKGEISPCSLQTLNNFPSVYEFDDVSKTVLPTKKTQNEKPPVPSDFEINNPQEPLSGASIIKKLEEEGFKKKGDYYDQIRKLVKERIMYKKKIKSEGSQYRTINSKFLENFYSINKDYVEKIKNGDLLSQNTKKKYYEKNDFSASKALKGCCVRGINKRTVTSSTPARDQLSNQETQNKLFKDYLKLNAESYLTLLSERKQRFLKNSKVMTVPHISHTKRSKTPSTTALTMPSPQTNVDDSNKKKKTGLSELYSPSKRDQKLRNFIDYKEDLDFFIKNKGVLDEELVFLNEISQIDNFDENYIQNTLDLLLKEDKNLLKIQQFVKSKADFECLKKEAEERRMMKKQAKEEKNSRNNKNLRFSALTRNNFFPEENHLHEGSEDDTSLPSLTEATLDGLYSQSLSLQKKILARKTKNFANKIKQFLKLEEISRTVERTNKMKLKSNS